MNTGWANKLADRPTVLILFGPTAVGKTSLLGRVCADRCEVINADSRQVYRFLDIGTAKPDLETRRRVRHHLIDVCNPSRQYTAGRFVRDAERLVEEVRRRGALPVIAGGAGYYIRNFIFGLPENPGTFPEIRVRLRREIRERGAAEMYGELAAVDAAAAARISPNDRYRICRALEVFRGCGRPLSSFRVPDRLREEYRFVIVGLDRPRRELYERIEKRIDAMFDAGLVAETAAALAAGYDERSPGLRSIGYREVLDLRSAGCGTLEATVAEVKRNTRRYAKRQLTFFRRFPVDHVIHPDEADSLRRIIESECGS